jgi:hypothetical protein
MEGDARLPDEIPVLVPVGHVADDVERLTRADHRERADVRAERPERRPPDVDDLDSVAPLRVAVDDGELHPVESGEVDLLNLRRGHDHEVDVAHARIEAAGDRRPVEVDPDKVAAEDGANAGNQCLEERFQRRVVAVHRARFGVGARSVNHRVQASSRVCQPARARKCPSLGGTGPRALGFESRVHRAMLRRRVHPCMQAAGRQADWHLGSGLRTRRCWRSFQTSPSTNGRWTVPTRVGLSASSSNTSPRVT